MDTLTFTLSPGRLLRFTARIVLLFGSLTAVSLVVNHSNTVLLVSVMSLMVALFALGAAGGRTTLSSEGLRVHRFFVPMRLRPWSEIASVAEKQARSTSLMTVRTTGGKEYTLPYPVNTASNPDPEFPAHRDQVIAYWRKQARAAKGAKAAGKRRG
ncbi:hypothetical protein P3T37_006860 [Kitasatospora sp. MAA4]|uniref:hypothetical protein n=1 Tax=Kitasatospora sp. MAA4 TaxID=3035093 RepID=UPI0024730C6B|nr:hypothetical protein [Kitasatospora sp. MAA4]MDH6137428.1 hypothetical protein [Kitasatospora sp. MAA4]